MKDVDKEPRKKLEKLDKEIYTKPVIIKHQRLRDITAGYAGSTSISE